MGIEFTERGFAFMSFKDKYGQECSIQDSSLATEDCIWLGVDRGIDEEINVRMHLTVEHVEKLMPLLENFLNYGTIKREGK